MKTNNDLLWAVNGAVEGYVSWRANNAVERAVVVTVNRTVTEVMDWVVAVDWVVTEAAFHDPLHSALNEFLIDAGGATWRRPTT